MGFLVEHSKMRKDGSKLRNRDLNIDFVELDVGFHMRLSKMRKDASIKSYERLKNKLYNRP